MSINSDFQFKKLADYAFMLQDYRCASTTLDNLKREFQSSKMWRHYGATLYLMGLCSIFLPVLKDEDKHFEAALSVFSSKCNSSYHSVKTIWTCIEYFRHKGLYGDCIPWLVRQALDIPPVISALFLEQASNCFIRPEVGMQRKAMLQLLLASEKYRQVGLLQNSVRCYRTLQPAIQKWNLISSHCLVELAKNLIDLQQYEEAFETLCNVKNIELLNETQQRFYVEQLARTYSLKVIIFSLTEYE